MPDDETSGMYCLACDYDLRGLSGHSCPECGRSFHPDDPTSFASAPPWSSYLRAGPVAATLIASLCILIMLTGFVGVVSLSGDPWVAWNHFFGMTQVGLACVVMLFYVEWALIGAWMCWLFINRRSVWQRVAAILVMCALVAVACFLVWGTSHFPWDYVPDIYYRQDELKP